jgi:hypothetical protein
MSTALTLPTSFGPLSTKFAALPAADELGAGISSSFAILTYKGKVWTVNYQGNSKTLMREDGDGPKSSVEVVIVKAASPLAKIFYEAGYVEGSKSAPDCWSTNGVVPDAGASKRQHTNCAACPKNQWGSRANDVTGKQAKACQDSKRLAVVPVQDVDNDVLGGPMLLRVPAASLREMKQFNDVLQQNGYPYFAIATRIAFDPAAAYPKFVFSAMRPLTDEEADKVLKLRDDIRTTRILDEVNDFEGVAAAEVPKVQFEQAPVSNVVPLAPKTASPPVVTPAAPAGPTPAELAAQKIAAARAKAAEAARKAAEEAAAELAALEAEAAAAAPEPVEVLDTTVVTETAAAPADFESMLDALIKA